MLQLIANLKRISISVPIITLLLFVGPCTDVFAQAQPKNDQAARIQTLNAIQEANDL